MDYWRRVLNEVQRNTNINGGFRWTNILDETEEVVDPEHELKVAQLRRYYSQTYEIGPAFPGLYLTQREAECVWQLSMGKTLRQTGDALQLSPRTVEYYVRRIREKLGCKTKSDVMQLLHRIEFIERLRHRLVRQEGLPCSLELGVRKQPVFN